MLSGGIIVVYTRSQKNNNNKNLSLNFLLFLSELNLKLDNDFSALSYYSLIFFFSLLLSIKLMLFQLLLSLLRAKTIEIVIERKEAMNKGTKQKQKKVSKEVKLKSDNDC